MFYQRLSEFGVIIVLVSSLLVGAGCGEAGTERVARDQVPRLVDKQAEAVAGQKARPEMTSVPPKVDVETLDVLKSLRDSWLKNDN